MLVSEPFHLKYRPLKLKDLIGQDTVISRLNGMIKDKNLPSSILFSGPSGSGKTTTMRIVARTLNCDTFKSCGKCKNCQRFDTKSHPDY